MSRIRKDDEHEEGKTRDQATIAATTAVVTYLGAGYYTEAVETEARQKEERNREASISLIRYHNCLVDSL